MADVGLDTIFLEEDDDEMMNNNSDSDGDMSNISNMSEDSSNSETEGVILNAIQVAIDQFNYVYGGSLDNSIQWGVGPKHITDLDPAVCELELRFRKIHLQEISDLLYIRMAPFLECETKERIKCGNRYKGGFEEMFMMYLYRIAMSKSQ